MVGRLLKRSPRDKPMCTEDRICRFYEAKLAAIAAPDRRYYLNSSPTLTDRAAYAARQAQLEDVRSGFYAELAAFRKDGDVWLGRCRSLARKRAPLRF